MMDRSSPSAWLMGKQRWLQVLTVSLLFASQMVWFVYIFSNPGNKLTDYHVYDVFSTAAAKGLDPYSVERSDVDAIASSRWGLRWQDLPILPPSPVSGRLGLHYSPPFFVMFRPLASLPPLEAARIWFLASCVALDLAIFLLSLLQRGHWIDPAMCVLTAIFGPAIQTLEGGQINTFLLLAVVIALFGLERGKYALIGFGLSLAVLIRPLPAILALFVFLLWRRETKGLIWSSFGLIFFGALSLPFGGFQLWVEYISAIVSFGTKAVGDNYVEGVSIWTPVNRLLPDQTAYLVGIGLSLGVITIILFALSQIRSHDWSLEWSLILTGALLAAPGTWFHYLVLLLIPMAYLSRNFSLQFPPRRLTWMQISVLAVFLLLMIHILTWRRFESQPVLSSWGTLALVILLVALVWQVLAQRQRIPRPAYTAPSAIADC